MVSRVVDFCFEVRKPLEQNLTRSRATLYGRVRKRHARYVGNAVRYGIYMNSRKMLTVCSYVHADVGNGVTTHLESEN